MRLFVSLLCAVTMLACRERVETARSDDREIAASDTTAAAGDERPCVGEWESLENGLRYRTAGCRERGDEFALHVVELDPALWTIDVDSGPRRPMSEAVSAANAKFAINANFFDVKDQPLGVVVSSGRVVQPAHPVSWQAVFSIDRDGTPRIVRRADWRSERSDVFAAVQAGPRLVVDGAKNDVAKAEPSLRSGVCITKDRLVRFFVTTEGSYADVSEMVDIASKSEADGGLGCEDAMLFDGGPSAQLYLSTSGRKISMDGDVVPVYVVAKPKA